LQQLSFPVLLVWGIDKEWIIVYGIKGNRLIIANPCNLNQTSETISQKMFEENWDGQLW
jgi:ABC-type bacteriocin/lantibiotic exporter with double-glycine peptidase domain